MSIYAFIPKKKKITDHRSEAGGYYEAACEECGDLFYPKRKTGRFCSKSCQLLSWNRRKAAQKEGAAKPSRFPDAIVTRDNLGSYLVKKYKSENEVFRQLIGKDILSVCLGIVPGAEYTHACLPYSVRCMSEREYAIIPKPSLQEESGATSMGELEKTKKEQAAGH